MIKRIIQLGIISLTIISLAGCAGQIVPKSKFAWPEMANSKLPGKLAIYIPANLADTTIDCSGGEAGSKSQRLAIGRGVFQMTQSTALLVFHDIKMLSEKPSLESLKTQGFRGLIQADSIFIKLQFPDITTADSFLTGRSDMSIRSRVYYSTVDFLAKENTARSFSPDNEVGKVMNNADEMNMNVVIKDITSRALGENADYLARTLVYIYGAR